MPTIADVMAKYPWLTTEQAAAILRSTAMNTAAGNPIDPLNLSPMSLAFGPTFGLKNPNYELPKEDSGLFGLIDKAIPDDLGGAALMFGGLAAGLGGLESLGLGGAEAAGAGGAMDMGVGLSEMYGPGSAFQTGIGAGAGDAAWGANPASEYADWASQGGGVDPGTTISPQINAQLAKLGLPTVTNPSGLSEILSKITPGQWLSTAGSVLSGLLGYSASQAAAKALGKGAESQQGLLKYMYDQNRADLEPWRKAGVGALGNLTNLTTPGKQLDTAMLDPGYAFRQSEGEKGINRAAAARGMWDSGRTYKALDRFNQDYATGEFGNVFNRNAALAGIGQTATGQGVNAGQTYAQNAGESMLQAANARASGYMGGANAISGTLASFLNNYNQNEMLDKLISAKYGT